MTSSEISGVVNANAALTKLAEIQTTLVNDINASMELPWSGDATHEAKFFEALGNQAANAWHKNGILINAALTMGASYASIRKPDTICIVCADGFVVPSGVAFDFESAPLAIWHIPAATKADALALIALGDEAVTGALMAAQP